MDFGSVNWLAVVACVVSNMIIGSIWYNPATFFKTWWKGIGKKETDRAELLGHDVDPDRGGSIRRGGFCFHAGEGHGRHGGCGAGNRIHDLAWLRRNDEHRESSVRRAALGGVVHRDRESSGESPGDGRHSRSLALGSMRWSSLLVAGRGP